MVPAALRPFFLTPFPLPVRAVGSDIDDPAFAGRDRPGLVEESLTAYEVAYTGTIAGRTTVGAAFYINDTDDNINFIASPGDGQFRCRTTRRSRPRPGSARRRRAADSRCPCPYRVRGGRASARGILLPRNLTYRTSARSATGRRAVDRPHVRAQLERLANYSWQARRSADDVGSPERYRRPRSPGPRQR